MRLSMNKLISIIIPVHNIRNCSLGSVDSVIGQINEISPYFDIIIVDDYSSDGSFEIIKSYDRYNFIHIYHNIKSKGVSGARNTGIFYSKSDWLMFLDCDDILPAGSLNYLVSFLSSIGSNADLYLFNAYFNGSDKFRFFSDSFKLEKSNYSVLIDSITGISVNNSLISNSGMMGVCWAALYKSDIIKKNKLLFDERVSFMEDLKFKLSYIAFTERIECIDRYIYNYISHDSSLMHNISPNREHSLVILLKDCLNCDSIFASLLSRRSIYCFTLRVYLQLVEDLSISNNSSLQEEISSEIHGLISTHKLIYMAMQSILGRSFFQNLILFLSFCCSFKILAVIYNTKSFILNKI